MISTMPPEVSTFDHTPTLLVTGSGLRSRRLRGSGYRCNLPSGFLAVARSHGLPLWHGLMTVPPRTTEGLPVGDSAGLPVAGDKRIAGIQSRRGTLPHSHRSLRLLPDLLGGGMAAGVRVSVELPARGEEPHFCHDAKQLRVNAYVIMPTHLHLIVFDAE